MKTLLAVLLAVSATAQTRGTFSYEKETSLSGAAETVTIHLPLASSRTVQFVGATVYCSVACTFTLTRDGTAPTNTAGTAVAVNSGGSAGAVPYHTSNVGAGTQIKKYNVAAGEEKSIDLQDKGLTAGGNLTITTSSITGTARVYFQWREF